MAATSLPRSSGPSAAAETGERVSAVRPAPAPACSNVRREIWLAFIPAPPRPSHHVTPAGWAKSPMSDESRRAGRARDFAHAPESRDCSAWALRTRHRKFLLIRADAAPTVGPRLTPPALHPRLQRLPNPLLPH